MPAMKEDEAIDFCFFGQQITVFLQIADRPRNECGDYRTAFKVINPPEIPLDPGCSLPRRPSADEAG